VPGLAAAVVVIALDQEQSPVVAYGVALAAGAAALFGLLAARVPANKMFSAFSDL
jgi:hypothetical protein